MACFLIGPAGGRVVSPSRTSRGQGYVSPHRTGRSQRGVCLIGPVGGRTVCFLSAAVEGRAVFPLSRTMGVSLTTVGNAVLLSMTTRRQGSVSLYDH